MFNEKSENVNLVFCSVKAKYQGKTLVPRLDGRGRSSIRNLSFGNQILLVNYLSYLRQQMFY